MPVHSGWIFTGRARSPPRDSTATSAVMSFVVLAMGRGVFSSWAYKIRPVSPSISTAEAAEVAGAAATGHTSVKLSKNVTSTRRTCMGCVSLPNGVFGIGCPVLQRKYGA